VTVNTVKLDADTLLTVPEDPPAAGPERALDPALAETAWADVAEADVAVATAPEPVGTSGYREGRGADGDRPGESPREHGLITSDSVDPEL
jgi:hypothetical protein